MPQGHCPADFKEFGAFTEAPAGLVPHHDPRGRRLSTAPRYELFASMGQTVDKKGLIPRQKTYPQLHPHPQGPFYRGFQPHISLYIQLDKVVFNQIWLYHHHIALDLYTDLKLGQGISGTLSHRRSGADAGHWKTRAALGSLREADTMACHYEHRRPNGQRWARKLNRPGNAPRGTCKKKPGVGPGF